ncbi:NAD(P)-dependent oxidoreductase [Grimontia sp. S25]|uniref:NAD(P)-dependent oxidoreductase n=1 Tax=Grimontia sedimenti TaxID=2711294 RepID=A0A6M1R964_9GAMM|nr:NAD(P)-dependent oxidoreductase [Grimontia sedimenti]NGN96650.1 NAD(P)-dependent oxidoreductase [Grimontia sedimenti]
MHIGFIGLGRMGWLMAANLAKAGVSLTVWNRSRGKSVALVEEYPDVNIAENPAHIARDCDLVFTMIADDEAAKVVYFSQESGLIAPLDRRAQHWVDMSTISPVLSEEIATLAKAYEVMYVDAPVSGSLNAAEAGELVFMVGASEALTPDVHYCLSIMGKSIFQMGEAGRGHAAKLLINSVIHSQNQIVGEILALAASCNIDQTALLTLLGESAAGSAMIRFRTPLYLNQSEDVTFALTLARKDMALTKEMASQLGWSLSQINTNLEQLEAAEHSGFGEMDMAAIATYIAATNSQNEE